MRRMGNRLTINWSVALLAVVAASALARTQQPRVIDRAGSLPVALNEDFQFRKTKLYLLTEAAPGHVEEVRRLVESQSDWALIDKAAIRDGMTTMIDDGLAKIRAGVTSAAEVLRVTTVR